MDYFWLLCGLWVGFLQAASMRWRLRKRVASGELSADDVASFTRRFALWIFLPCLALWLLQRSLGHDASPFFLKWPSPQGTLAAGLQIFIWIALLFWVFVRDGAEDLCFYWRAGGETCSPIMIKLGAIAAVLSGIFAWAGALPPR